jgi:hypothetical protein
MVDNLVEQPGFSQGRITFVIDDCVIEWGFFLTDTWVSEQHKG